MKGSDDHLDLTPLSGQRNEACLQLMSGVWTARTNDKPPQSSVLTAQTGTTISSLSIQASLTAQTGMFQYAWLSDKLAVQCVFELITQGK